MCGDEKKFLIERFQSMTLDDLKSELEKEEGKIDEAGMTFEGEIEKLQEKYEQLSNGRGDTIADVKSAGLGLMKSVIVHREALNVKSEL